MPIRLHGITDSHNLADGVILYLITAGLAILIKRRHTVFEGFSLVSYLIKLVYHGSLFVMSSNLAILFEKVRLKKTSSICYNFARKCFFNGVFLFVETDPQASSDLFEIIDKVNTQSKVCQATGTEFDLNQTVKASIKNLERS